MKAAMRGIDLILEQDMNVRIVMLPPGEDPDSFIRKNGTLACKKFIRDQARDFIVFKTALLLTDTKDDPIKKSGAIKDIVRSIAQIPDMVTRSVYIKQCSQLLGVDEQILILETNKIQRKKLPVPMPSIYTLTLCLFLGAHGVPSLR